MCPIVVATDTVTMVSAPASAVTVATIAQVVPARAIVMVTEFATTTNAIATPDSVEKTAVMRFAVPIVCMVNASTTNAFASKVSLDGIVTPAHVAAKSCSTQRQSVIGQRFTKPFCSGHGVCSVDHRCECDVGFTGEICELRACPEIALLMACV